MSSSGRSRQNQAIVSENGGKIKVIDDQRLPQNYPRWVCPSYKKASFVRSIPVNAQQTFSNSDTIQFAVNGDSNVMIDCTESYIEFSIDLAGGAVGANLSATAVNKAIAGFTGQYAALRNPNTGERIITDDNVVDTNTMSYVYCRNSNCLFDRFEVRDLSTNTLLDSVENPGLLTTVNLNGQSEEFWGDEGLELADKYMATVHSFEDDHKMGNATNIAIADVTTDCLTASPSHRIPVLAPNPADFKATTIVPAITSTVNYAAQTVANTFTGTGIFPEVAKQLQLMKNSMAINGYRFRIPIPSDLLNSCIMQSPVYNKLLLQLPLNSYARAFTDVRSTFAAGTSRWVRTSNFSSFILSNVNLILKKYIVSPPMEQAIALVYNSSGWEVPFTKFIRDSINLPTSSQSVTYTFQHPEISNLEKLVFIVQKESDCAEDCKLSHYEFGMGNRYDHITPTDYDGIKQIRVRYLGDKSLADDSEILQIAPYHTQFFKEMAIGCFGEAETSNVLAQLYDGIDTKTKIFNGMNTGFAVLLDFRTLRGAEKSGLNLSESAVSIELEFNNHPEALRIAVYACCSAVLQIKAGTSPVVKT